MKSKLLKSKELNVVKEISKKTQYSRLPLERIPKITIQPNLDHPTVKIFKNAENMSCFVFTSLKITKKQGFYFFYP